MNIIIFQILKDISPLPNQMLLNVINNPNENSQPQKIHSLIKTLEGLTFSKKLFSPQGKIISSLLSCKETLFETDSNISFVTYIHDFPLAQLFIANLCQEHGYMPSK